MTDRLLDDAIAAARLCATEGVDDGAATRLRLRESLAKRRGSRRIVTIIAAVIATLFGSTAFAYYVKGWRPNAEAPVTPVVVVEEPAAAVEPKLPVRTVHRELVPAAPIEPPKPRLALPPAVAPTPPSPVVAPDPELAAYRVAHEAHFRGGDASAALAAWDAYLAQFPDGRLALEARWDRALVLVKLHRYREAETALQPFADGTYRRAEAQKLLAAIRQR